MNPLRVWLDREPVGQLAFDGASSRFAFDYLPAWTARATAFPISPRLPLRPPAEPGAEARSTEVRLFFENLLPEGDALDHAAQANGISRANVFGLVLALGRETAGALRVELVGDDGGALMPAAAPGPALRLVTPQQLSDRLRERDQLPFSVWDGRVRLSIAGYQDKIAVYERDGAWYLVDGPELASTVIVKPAPQRARLASLPANEHLCMQLARRVGVAAAATRLVHVPEPVLLVRRFDRIERGGRVQRLHLIDGCQALGLPPWMKYERPHGDAPDVRNIRDGASLPRLFAALALSATPARDRLALLRWTILQVLLGNADAHAKNLSFFCDIAGLALAPAYDLVCMPALGDERLSDSFAMAIGDAFSPAELTPFEWAGFAAACGLPIKLVARELAKLANALAQQLPGLAALAAEDGIEPVVAQGIAGVVEAQALRCLELAPRVAKVRPGDL
jgi:serine/threonine-protein kinase HipA